jgi:site-specific recombinase XerD
MTAKKSEKQIIGECNFTYLEWLIETYQEGLIEGNPRLEDLYVIGVQDIEDDALPMFKSLNRTEQDKLLVNINKIDEYLLKRFKTKHPTYRYFETWMTELFVEPHKRESELKIVDRIEKCAKVSASQYIENFIQDTLPYTQDLNILIKRVIVSACAFGGVVSPKLLKCVFDVLTEKQPTLHSINDDIFADLLYKQFGHPTNVKIKEAGFNSLMSLRRWFLDPISQVLVLEFLQEHARQPSTEIPPFSDLIASIYKDLELRRRDISLSHLLSVIFDSALNLTRIEFPAFLKTYAKGDVFSGSTPLGSLKSFCKPELSSNNALKCNSNKENYDKRKLFFTVSDDLTRSQVTKDEQLLDQLKEHCKLETAYIDSLGGCLVVSNKVLQQVRQDLISKTQAILLQKEEMSFHAEILVSWICDGIQTRTSGKQTSKSNSCKKKYRWEIGKGTPYRYLSLLSDSWLEMSQTQDISELGQSEVQEAHDELIQRLSKDNKLAKDIVPVLFSFISENYREDVAIPETIAGNSKNSHVRSQLVPESVFQKTRQIMVNQFAGRSESYKRNVDLILIIAYRCGMRPSEIYSLRVDDVSTIGQDCVIRMGKTDSAKRSIPISLLLLPTELSTFKAHVYARKIQAQSQDTLLFSQRVEISVPFDHVSINRKVTEIFSSYTELRTVCYQSRHSAISLLILICFCDLKTAQNFTAYGEEQIKKIKEYFSADPRKTLYQISRFAGHNSPKTTLSCYTHVLDMCLKYYLNKVHTKISIKRCARLLKTTQRDLRKVIEVDVNGKVDLHEIVPFLKKEFKKHISTELKTNGQEQPYRFKHMLEHEPTLPDLQQVLSLANTNETDENISACLAINEQWVTNVKLKAKRLYESQDYKTRRDKSTIVRSKKDIYPVPMVIPHNETSDAEHIFNSLIISKKRLEVLSSFLKVSLDHSYLTLKSLSEVEQVISTMNEDLNSERWFVTVDWPEGFNKEITEEALQNILKNINYKMRGKCVSNKHYNKGRFELTLLRPNILKDSNKHASGDIVKYGTNSLRVAVFYATLFCHAREKVNIDLQIKLDFG